MDNNIELLSRVTVFKGRIVDIIHQKISFFGKILEYEITHRPSIVIIIPIFLSKEILLIKQYRASLNQFIWEFPGGVIEKGESVVEAARRELKEETGYNALNVEFVDSFYAAPHFSDEKIFICLATKLISGEPNLQEKELISTELFTKSELDTKYYNKELLDSKTLIAYHILEHDFHDILAKLKIDSKDGNNDR